MTENDRRNRKAISERVRTIVDEAAGVAEDVGETVRGTVEDALNARKKVVMVRLNDASVDCLDDLVEAGIAGSRSEAAAYLIAQGIDAKKDTFDRIKDKIAEIRKAKEELKELMKDKPTND